MQRKDISSEEHYASLDAAWRAYKEEGSSTARDYIVISYTPLADRIAKKVYRKKPWIFDLNDLRQAGFIGLMNAVEKFDPKRGILFSTFAPMRILGSIYDEINAIDWTPRSVREKIRAVIRATEKHYADHQHPPSAQELAQISGLTAENVKLALKLAPKTYISNVDSTMVAEYEASNPDNGVELLSSTGTYHETVEDTIDALYVTSALEEAIQYLSPEERKVVQLHFYEGKTLRDVAAVLNCSASKVSHLRKSALRKLQRDPNVRDIRN